MRDRTELLADLREAVTRAHNTGASHAVVDLPTSDDLLALLESAPQPREAPDAAS